MKPRKNQRGFTLIELILTMVVISVGLFGMMLLFDNVTRNALEGDMSTMATFLARERLEKIVFDKVYQGYDYVANAKYPVTENVTLGSYNFVRTVNIYEVSKTDLSTTQANSGFKRVEVTVNWGGLPKQRILEITLLTKY